MSDITTDFIKATNKIYAKVAAILTHLQIIEGEVKLIREQPIKDTHEPHPNADTSNSQDQPKAVLSNTAQASQSSRDNNRGYDEGSN